jgi:hypothetical protein
VSTVLTPARHMSSACILLPPGLKKSQLNAGRARGWVLQNRRQREKGLRRLPSVTGRRVATLQSSPAATSAQMRICSQNILDPDATPQHPLAI